jgi:hypothetical protein
MGRPRLPPPEDFADAFVQHGWEAKDLLRMDTSRFKRAMAECGEKDLKRRRKNYVLGRRLSSLKLGG